MLLPPALGVIPCGRVTPLPPCSADLVRERDRSQMRQRLLLAALHLGSLMLLDGRCLPPARSAASATASARRRLRRRRRFRRRSRTRFFPRRARSFAASTTHPRSTALRRRVVVVAAPPPLLPPVAARPARTATATARTARGRAVVVLR